MTEQIQPTLDEQFEKINALKANWIKDPCWDIEDTEGFEEYHDYLFAWRKDLEKKHQLAAQARKKLRIETIQKELGIADGAIAESLHTFSEIESSLDLDFMVGDCGSANALAAYIISRSQVQATLLLASQIKRVADYLSDKIEMDASDNNLDFMTRLYSQDK